MTMPANIFSTGFKTQRLGLMLAVIMVIMVYVGCLAMAAQATLARTSLTWGDNLQHRYTIEIAAQVDEALSARAQRAEHVATLLRSMPEVKQVSIIPDEDTASLIKPWISDPTLLTALPLPVLMDVGIKPGQNVTGDGLKTRLSEHGAVVQVHAHAGWMNALLGFLKGLGYLAVIMLALTALAITIMISVVCRAAIAVQHDTIELLHFMGATDRSIAREFQQHIYRLALPASLIGFLAAAVTVVLLVLLLKSLGGISLIESSSWVTVGGVMFLIPVGAICLAILTARLSVLKLLQRLT